MLQCLYDILPKEIVTEIAIFDGRVFRAYLRDYISEVYSCAYKKYFGYRHSLKFITGGFAASDLMYSMPFYTAWSTRLRMKYPQSLKTRKPRSHMRPYAGLIPIRRLVKEREALELEMCPYFKAASDFGWYRWRVPRPDEDIVSMPFQGP